jgi:uncharacterized protein (DUF2336 family)
MRLIAIDRIVRGLAAAPGCGNAWRSRRHIARALARDQPDFEAYDFDAAPFEAREFDTGEESSPPLLIETDLGEARGLAGLAAQKAMTQIAVQSKALASSAEQNNICRFAAWAQKADVEERVRAAGALARAYLSSNAPPPQRGAAAGGRLVDLRRDAEVCLTTMVEDVSPRVRQALAEALADAQGAPRHIVSALANDEPAIAGIVIARSPLLGDAELIECALASDDAVQIALARRPGLSEKIGAALVAVDRRAVVLALLENADAQLSPEALRGPAKRFDEDDEVRDALLARPELSAVERYDLFAAATKGLAAAPRLAVSANRMARARRDTLERCAILAASCEKRQLGDLMRHLRGSGVLTVSLLMRALICGGQEFFVAAAAELSDIAPERAAGFVREPFGSGFAALFGRTGLPHQFLDAFRIALAAIEEFGADDSERVSRPLIARMIGACEDARSSDLADLLPMLRRFETEAALREARLLAAPAAAVFEAADSAGAPRIAVDPGLGKMLSLLRRLESGHALAELEALTAFAEERRGFAEDESLAA